LTLGTHVLIECLCFQASDIETAIGVGNKCCWCCWRLSQLLDEEASDAGSQLVTPPRFMLRSTHGSILPWYPPQFGIPPTALKTLRDELIEQLCFAAKLFRTTSLQPAPESSGDESSPSFHVDAPDDDLVFETSHFTEQRRLLRSM